MSFDMQKAKKEFLRVLNLEAQAIVHAAEYFEKSDPRELQNALGLLLTSLNQGGKIIVTGVGKSGKIAQKISSTLTSTGSPSIFLHPTEASHGDLGIAQARDCVIALSHTGNTEELLDLVPSFKRRSIPVIGIGGNPESKLAGQCQAWIKSSVEQEACPHNLAPTTSTTLALAIGDAIATTLMLLRGFKPEEFAGNHPGGALGKRLSLYVKDLMHPANTIGLISPDSTLDQVLLESTQKKLGGVLVVEKEHLVGIITDGDIRRSLSHREKIFSMTAREIMTQNPITISPDQMAYEALQLMENRPSQISVLPVVDASKKPMGLIRLHDLVRAL